jgi:hypothetical protein
MPIDKPPLLGATPVATPPATTGKLFPVTISRSYASLGMKTEQRDIRGKPARVPCLVCHALVPAQDRNRFAARLQEFHQKVEIKHGEQTCRACHQVPGFDAFQLADGQRVPYSEVMRLCRQCHAQRLVEYEKGAHGGMSGYWDLTRGPRTRNHCLDCHNSHAPRVPQMVPAPRVRYRSGV